MSDLLSMLRRHRALIALSVIVTVILVGCYTFFAVPVYESTSVLRFEPDSVNLPQLVQQLSSENRINTEIDVLQGRSAAVRVIDSLGLRARVSKPRGGRVSELFALLQVAPSADTSTLDVHTGSDGAFSVTLPDSSRVLASGHLGDTVHAAGVTFALARAAMNTPKMRLEIASLENAVRSFESNLKVSRPSRDADLIDVQIRMTDPVLAAQAANVLAEQLISGHQEVQMARTGSTVDFLKQQSDTLGLQLRSAEDSLSAYRQRTGVVDAPEQARAQVSRLADIQAERGKVEVERNALAQLVREMHVDSAGDAPSDQANRLMAFPNLFSNQATAQLLASLAAVENERSTLLIRRTLQDPDVQVLTGRIREINRQLQQTAETYLQGLSNQAAGLDTLATRFGGTLDSLPKQEVQAARLERGVTVLDDLYTLIQRRLKEAEITQAMKDPAIRIIDPAVIADRPARPKPLVNMALAVVLGVLLGVGISLLRDMANHAVRSRSDAFSTTGLPALGAIPRVERHPRFAALHRHVRQLQTGSSVALAEVNPADGPIAPPALDSVEAATRIASILVTRPEVSAAYAEAFSQLQVNLALAHQEQPVKSIVFTSPLPGEGKTLTAINFALTAARRGLRVLLIDGDLRRGLVNEVFRSSRSPGFSELLSGAVSFDKASRRVFFDEGSSLMMLPSGGRVPSPARLQTSSRIRQVLEQVGAEFDLVVIDSPPINLLADAAVLGSAVDAVLLVVRAGYTRTAALRYAIEQLAAVRAPVVGTVLNDIDLRRRSGDDGSYRYLAEVEMYYADRE